jgi:hypothetical protein
MTPRVIFRPVVVSKIEVGSRLPSVVLIPATPDRRALLDLIIILCSATATDVSGITL